MGTPTMPKIPPSGYSFFYDFILGGAVSIENVWPIFSSFSSTGGDYLNFYFWSSILFYFSSFYDERVFIVS